LEFCFGDANKVQPYNTSRFTCALVSAIFDCAHEALAQDGWFVRTDVESDNLACGIYDAAETDLSLEFNPTFGIKEFLPLRSWRENKRKIRREKRSCCCRSQCVFELARQVFAVSGWLVKRQGEKSRFVDGRTY
jgi:hypothetical protein